jgi:hypothetical protein
MTDDGGVLGNLPRSRPGTRSEKRASAGGAAAAKAPRTASKRPGSAARRQPSAARRRRPKDEPGRPVGRRRGPVGEVIRGAAKAAETGVRVAGTVAHEVLRRVPRP